jgi:tetratricopeptide (TPR) repeat protein
VAGSDRSRRLEDALEAARRGDLRRAAEGYEALLADRPDDPGLLQRLGDALARAGDARGARGAFVRLAKVYRDGADDRRAIAALNRAAQQGQPDPEVLEQLGELLAGAGRAADARDPWSAALAAAQHAGDASRVWRLAGRLLDLDPTRGEWLEAARRAAALLDDRSVSAAGLWLDLAGRGGRAGSSDVVDEALRRSFHADPHGAGLARRAAGVARSIVRGGTGERAVAVCREVGDAGAPVAHLLGARIALDAGVVPLAADLALAATQSPDRLPGEWRDRAVDLLASVVSRDPSRGEVLARLESMSESAPSPPAEAPAAEAPPEPPSPPPAPEPSPPSSPARLREAPPAPEGPETIDDWIVFLEEEEDTAPVPRDAPGEAPEPSEPEGGSAFAARAAAEDRAEEATLDRLEGTLREAVDGHDDETTYQMAVGLLEMGLDDQAVELLDGLLDRTERAVDAALMAVRVLAKQGEHGRALAAGERALATGGGPTEAQQLLREELEHLRQAVGEAGSGG